MAGRRRDDGDEPSQGAAQGLRRGERRGRHLRALAGGRRLRARRRRQSGRPGQAAVRHHPAAAQRDRRAAPRPRAADGGRGRHDPPRADAGPSDALAAGRGPRLDRRPVRARPDPRRRGRVAPVARSRALPRADARVHGRDAPDHDGQHRSASAPRSTGAASASPWTRARRARCATAFKRLYDDGLAYRGRGARQLVPGLPDERLRPGGRSRRPRRARSGRSATTSCDARRHARTRRHGSRVATTRPETILGDTAVAVHPDDERYQALVGRTRAHPVRRARRADHRRRRGRARLRHRRRQDHAGPRPRRLRDRQAARPAADRRDDRRRRASTRPAGAYAGLDRDEARAADPGRPRGARRPGRARGRTRWSSGAASAATTSSSRASRRSGSSTSSRMADQGHARPCARAGRASCPPRFEKVFFDWMENIHDWNVSRQLWWGHRIPAWYCPDGHVTVSDRHDGPAACAACGRAGAELTQDPDIFDTWFSSGLWPFSTLGWPERTADLRALLPGHGHGDRLRHPLLLGRPDDDARRVADRREPPFGTVYLRGIVRDPYGAKMSKTKGNVDRPAGDHRRDRRRRPALRARQRPRAGRRPAPRSRRSSRARATSPTSSGTRPASCSAHGPRRCPPTQPLALPDAADLGPAEHWILGRCARDHRGRLRGAYDGVPVRRGRRACSTRPSGASTATGTSSWPRSSLADPRRRRRDGRPRGRRWPGCSIATCACSTR